MKDASAEAEGLKQPARVLPRAALAVCEDPVGSGSGPCGKS